MLAYVAGRAVRELSPGNYDLTPDDKRLLGHVIPGNAEFQPSGRVTFLLNFFDELRRRVP